MGFANNKYRYSAQNEGQQNITVLLSANSQDTGQSVNEIHTVWLLGRLSPASVANWLVSVIFSIRTNINKDIDESSTSKVREKLPKRSSLYRLSLRWVCRSQDVTAPLSQGCSTSDALYHLVSSQHNLSAMF